MRVIYIGTLAPATDLGGGTTWIHAGSQDATYVGGMALQGRDPEKWHDLRDRFIRRCNPLMWQRLMPASFKATLLRAAERDAARGDTQSGREVQDHFGAELAQRRRKYHAVDG